MIMKLQCKKNHIIAKRRYVLISSGLDETRKVIYNLYFITRNYANRPLHVIGGSKLTLWFASYETKKIINY